MEGALTFHARRCMSVRSPAQLRRTARVPNFCSCARGAELGGPTAAARWEGSEGEAGGTAGSDRQLCALLPPKLHPLLPGEGNEHDRCTSCMYAAWARIPLVGSGTNRTCVRTGRRLPHSLLVNHYHHSARQTLHQAESLISARESEETDELRIAAADMEEERRPEPIYPSMRRRRLRGQRCGITVHPDPTLSHNRIQMLVYR